MPTGNRHKVTVQAGKIPSPGLVEDRGIEVCCDPFLVLASTTETSRYYNDITGVFEKLYANTDTAEFVLEYNGADVAPIGVLVTFPNNEEYVSAFVIDWRQHLAANGTGCYKVRCDYEVNGITGSIYKGTYNLQPWTVHNASGTVRIHSIYNDFSRRHQINFTGSGFADTLRFNGFFGLMQPNFEVNNLTSVGFQKRKVENESTKSYELEMSPTTICYTSRLVDEHLLHANEINICDHNATNHDYRFQDIPVILKRETTPEFTYTPGSRLASVKATFEDKVQINESQYAGDLTSGTNASYELVGISTGVCEPVTGQNSDDTFTFTANSGDNVDLLDIDITTGSGILTFPSNKDIDLSSYYEMILPTGTRTPVNTVTSPDIEVGWYNNTANVTTGTGFVERTGGTGFGFNARVNFLIPTWGDFTLDFKLVGDDVFAGISFIDVSSSYTDIGFCISANGVTYYLYEVNSNVFNFGGRLSTDALKIERVAGEVNYYVNGVLKYTQPLVSSTQLSSGFMVFDSTLAGPGSRIEDILLTYL